jgi:hypothetical protein
MPNKAQLDQWLAVRTKRQDLPQRQFLPLRQANREIALPSRRFASIWLAMISRRHIVAAALAVLAAAPASADVDLLPHQAQYTLTLASTKSSSGILAVNGEMAVEYEESCDGWTFAQRLVLDVDSAQSNVRITSAVATFESRDGSSYRFAVRNTTDGQDNEQIEGSAKLSGRNGRGTAAFEKPEAKEIPLPPGTLFPMAHTADVIAEIQKGTKIVARKVFDGLTTDGGFLVNAVIGAPHAPFASPNADLKALLGRPSWPVDLAFFPLDSNDAEPQHEIRMRLFDNGVSEDMMMSFSDFVVRGRIAKFTPLPKANCR